MYSIYCIFYAESKYSNGNLYVDLKKKSCKISAFSLHSTSAWGLLMTQMANSYYGRNVTVTSCKPHFDFVVSMPFNSTNDAYTDHLNVDLSLEKLFRHPEFLYLLFRHSPVSVNRKTHTHFDTLCNLQVVNGTTHVWVDFFSERGVGNTSGKLLSN